MNVQKVVDMVYNAMGQRMIKHAAGNNPILYAYDQWRRPVGAYMFNTTTSTWDVLEEYLHLDGWRVVGVARPNATSGMTTPDLFPVLSDHLGTPRKILDGATGQAVWAWDAKEPFGHELPNENPSALGSFTFNLRFPGQVFDVETGLFHNGYRDYHAKLGRYVQSDPLGLEAGWNTYGYVGGNSLNAFDPLGLMEITVIMNRGAGFGWQPTFEVSFNSIAPSKLANMSSFGKAMNRAQNVITLMSPKSVGPLNPVEDFFECATLDHKLEKLYESYGYKEGQNLTEREMSNFLHDAYSRYPEFRELYPKPSLMMDRAIHNATEGGFRSWFYNLRGPDRAPNSYE